MVNPNATSLSLVDKLNVRDTLQKLHEAFPNLTLDELFKILDCIVLYKSFTNTSDIYVR